MPKNVLVIGGVALGPKAACRFKRLEPESKVTLIDQGAIISYGGCGIPYFVGGDVEKVEGLRATSAGVIRTPEFFHDLRDVDVQLGTRALKINRREKNRHRGRCRHRTNPRHRL